MAETRLFRYEALSSSLETTTPLTFNSSLACKLLLCFCSSSPLLDPMPPLSSNLFAMISLTGKLSIYRCSYSYTDTAKTSSCGASPQLDRPSHGRQTSACRQAPGQLPLDHHHHNLSARCRRRRFQALAIRRSHYPEPKRLGHHHHHHDPRLHWWPHVQPDPQGSLRLWRWKG